MSTFNELIDFTRSTTGTYLDSIVYGDELVVNNAFNDATGWYEPRNSSTISAVSNKLRSTADTGSTFGSATTLAGLTVGKQYKIQGTASSNNSSATVRIRVAIPQDLGVGTYITIGQELGSVTFNTDFIAIAETMYVGTIVTGHSGGDYVEVDSGFSVKEVTGGQVSGTPLLRTAAINEPRLEYDASGNPLGLLIEEARTNLVTYSNELLSAPWQGDALNVVSSIPSIDGGQCFKLSSNGGLSDYWIQSEVASNGQTKSIWARTVSGTGTAHILGHNSAPTTLVTLTEEWQRFSLNVNVGETGGTTFYAVDFRGSGTLSEILVFGAQLEAGSFPTSYIPTSGSTVTRNADIPSLPIERFSYNDTQGTLFAEFEHNAVNSSASFLVSDNTLNNRIQLTSRQTGTSGATAFISASGTTQTAFSASYNFIAGNKSTLAYKTNDCATTMNGYSVSADTSVTIPTVTTVYIGNINGGAKINGHIKRIQYYPKRLSNEELELLTQPSASPTMNLTFDGQATSTLVEGLHD